jgi:hypothetical protein
MHAPHGPCTDCPNGCTDGLTSSEGVLFRFINHCYVAPHHRLRRVVVYFQMLRQAIGSSYSRCLLLQGQLRLRAGAGKADMQG